MSPFSSLSATLFEKNKEKQSIRLQLLPYIQFGFSLMYKKRHSYMLMILLTSNIRLAVYTTGKLALVKPKSSGFLLIFTPIHHSDSIPE